LDQRSADQESARRLGERAKEFTALQQTVRILQDESRPLRDLMSDVVRQLPPAWQYPEITGARVFFRDLDVRSPAFRPTEWMQSARFTTLRGEQGGVEVCYLEERPPAAEGPFLEGERALLDSLAEMLRFHFQHVAALEALRQAQADLEAQVRLRTRLASELSLSEARQRRIIAGELHDHIGQALAFIRMRLSRLQGDAVFSGFENSIADIVRLVEQAINSTRSLTFQISPPVLYELGLQAALEWLCERLGQEHEVNLRVDADDAIDALPDDTRVVLFQAVRELIVNAIKHAEPRHIVVSAALSGGEATVSVVDDGRGFDVARLNTSGAEVTTFGLFSIQERLNYLGGSMTIASQQGSGTSVILRAPVRTASAGETP
jgi:signal transduction histidine kinase